MEDKKKKNRLMILAGSCFQIPLIKRAKELGKFVITVDYKPTNPGHALGDKYLDIDITDKERLLEHARKEEIDGIICYATDVGVVSASFVSQNMNLNGNSLDAVCILSNKDRFRKFLSENGFHTPRSRCVTSLEDAKEFFNALNPCSGESLSKYLREMIDERQAALRQLALRPTTNGAKPNRAIKKLLSKNRSCVIKPTDSSGSKGVFVVKSIRDLESRFRESMSFSRSKKVIIEEYLKRDELQIGGDGFSLGGRLIFSCFCNETRGRLSMMPMDSMVPCRSRYVKAIRHDLQRLFNLLELTDGAYNFDILVSNGRVYIIEIGARCGGDFLPQIIQHRTGVSLTDLVIKNSLREEIRAQDTKQNLSKHCFAGYIIHSQKDGVYDSISFDKSLDIVDCIMFVSRGDAVKRLENSSQTIGILITRFKNVRHMHYTIRNMDRFYRVKLAGEKG